MLFDARVPVVFGGVTQAGADAALLIQGDGAAPLGAVVSRFRLDAAARHPMGCACCAPRGPAAQALAALALGRARGDLPFFRRVIAVVDAAGEAAVRQALEQDALSMTRFRVEV